MLHIIGKLIAGWIGYLKRLKKAEKSTGKILYILAKIENKLKCYQY